MSIGLALILIILVVVIMLETTFQDIKRYLYESEVESAGTRRTGLRIH